MSEIKFYLKREFLKTPLSGKSPNILYYSPSKKLETRNSLKVGKRAIICATSAEVFEWKERRKKYRYYRCSPRTPLYKRCQLVRRRLNFDNVDDSIKTVDPSPQSQKRTKLELPKVVISSPQKSELDIDNYENMKKSRRTSSKKFKELYSPSTNELIKSLYPYKAHGCFGIVLQNTYKGSRVAIKIIRRSRLVQSEQNGIGLEHSNIVGVLKIIPTGAQQTDYYVITNYFRQSENLQSLLDNEHRAISFQRILKYTLDICEGLNYLHDKFILHLNLKPINILTFSNDTCKIGNFGNSVKYELEEYYSKNLYKTISESEYCSPEALKRQRLTKASDVYSLAITMWQMVHRSLPYDGSIQRQLLYQKIKNGLRPHITPIPKTQKNENRYMEIYTQCWSVDPADRLLLFDVLHEIKLMYILI